MKKKILVTFAAVVVTAFAGYGVSKSMNNSNNELSELALANIEVLAQNEGDNEWNNWRQWWSQGATKDEREETRPCYNEQSGNVGGGVSGSWGSVGGDYSSSQSGSNGRREIICPYGYTNCTSYGCD